LLSLSASASASAATAGFATTASGGGDAFTTTAAAAAAAAASAFGSCAAAGLSSLAGVPALLPIGRLSVVLYYVCMFLFYYVLACPIVSFIMGVYLATTGR
jgi:hypothetical protein